MTSIVETIDFYFLSHGLPLFLALFVVGSAIIVSKDRNPLSAGALIGFTLILIGYCMQNFGPYTVTYTQDGSARIKYTWLFSAGRHISGLGIFVASAFYLLKAIKYATHKSA